jgi:plastocyanin
MTARRLVMIAMVGILPASQPVAAPTTGSVTGRVVVVDHGKPQPNAPVWVYLLDVHRRPHAGNYGAHVTARVSQKNQHFDPVYTVVPIGATVRFPNDDNQDHSVFSPTKDEFDFGRYKPGPGKDHVFRWATEFDIYCDLHRDMWAKVKVVDSPWIAKVDHGQFTIGDVPPGDYKVVAWTPDSTEVMSAAVAVSAGAVVSLGAELHPQLGHPAATHLNKDHQPYPIYP